MYFIAISCILDSTNNSYNIYLLLLSQSVSKQDSYKIVQLGLLFVH